MEDQLFERIKDFFKKNWGYNCDYLDRTTTLEKDLGITGDDADEIVSMFIKEFKISDYAEFDISLYFGSEPFDLMEPILNFFGKHKMERKPLSLRDLEKAVVESKLL